jgi:hypothetical protein
MPTQREPRVSAEGRRCNWLLATTARGSPGVQQMNVGSWTCFVLLHSYRREFKRVHRLRLTMLSRSFSIYVLYAHVAVSRMRFCKGTLALSPRVHFGWRSLHRKKSVPHAVVKLHPERTYFVFYSHVLRCLRVWKISNRVSPGRRHSSTKYFIKLWSTSCGKNPSRSLIHFRSHVLTSRDGSAWTSSSSCATSASKTPGMLGTSVARQATMTDGEADDAVLRRRRRRRRATTRTCGEDDAVRRRSRR